MSWTGQLEGEAPAEPHLVAVHGSARREARPPGPRPHPGPLL